MINVRQSLTQFMVIEFNHDMSANALNLLMILVAPSSLFTNYLQAVRDCAPGLLSGLKAVAVQQVLRGLIEEPPSDGTAVLCSLYSRLGEWR